MNIRETVAKTTGLAKKAGAVLSNEKGILRELKREHGEVSALMKQVQRGEVSLRQRLFPTIRIELLSHAVAEQEAFYQELERYGQLRALAQEHTRDHQQIEALIEQLDKTPYNLGVWTETFEKLVQQVEGHVHKEENELFPRVKEIMSGEQLTHMQECFERAKQRRRQQLQQTTGTPEQARGPRTDLGSKATGTVGGARGTDIPFPPGGTPQ